MEARVLKGRNSKDKEREVKFKTTANYPTFKVRSNTKYSSSSKRKRVVR